MMRLTNPNATKEAKRLFAFIASLRGKRILTGQQECGRHGDFDDEMRYIQSVTDSLPAIRGLDFIHDDYDGTVQRSKEWAAKGGIVSICWHWGAPPDGFGYPDSQKEIDMEASLTEGTDLHNAILRHMDRAAAALKELQEANIPVLWRPFHEFDGQWFWWGKGGAEPFIRLWRMMYDRYTNLHKLNNLIWVLGYSGELKDGWYPGDAYCDIVGTDDYSVGTNIKKYSWLYERFGDRKPIPYHECGPIPDPDDLIRDGAHWLWFLTWHTIHIKEQNTPEHLRHVYSHPYTITLEELRELYPQNT
ncbi:MAG: mannan endo-1,4-beta-mannosidase A and B [Ruminococcus sp.]|nr:mannan endo-1,4-beta-mannosidase A and B [Ruminococcus sp.]